MVDFSDVMEFAASHRTCGGIAPAVGVQPSGGYLLTLTCACGATLDRRVSADEAARAPFLTGAPAAEAPRRPEPPRVTPSPELQRAMQEALEAEEAEVPPAPVAERQAPRVAPSPELEAVLREALEAEEAAAPTPARAPRPTAPPTDAGARTAPSAEIEDVLRKAVAASDAELERGTVAPPPKRAAPPPMSNVQATVRAALREQTRLRVDLAKDRPGARPTSRTRRLGLMALAMLTAAAAVFYVAQGPEPETPAPIMSTTDLLGAAPAQNEPGSYGNAILALRRVQAASVPTVSLPTYETQVARAQTVIGRYVESDGLAEAKRNVRAILDLHLLAVAAWRIRAVDTPQAWEPVSRSPALDLCAPVRNAAYVAERPGQDNARARGRAVALAIPLLWECASTRLAELDPVR
jgi:hypothetical protein